MPRKLEPRHVKIIRYSTPDGKRCTKDTPGAIRSVELSETYYAYLVLDGKRQRVSLETTEIGQAWVKLRELQRRSREEAAGIYDRTIAAAERPLTEHVVEWQEAIRARGTSSKQAHMLGHDVLTLASLAKPAWIRITDVTEESALGALARLQGEQGRSAQTRNHYRSHLRQFCAWLVRTGRLRSHPVLGIEPVNVDLDRRHDRRSPTEEEIGALFAYLAKPTAAFRRRMSGPQRALGYKVAMATGLRADELRSLRRQSFDLDTRTVTVEAAYSKHRRVDVQPLPPWLVEELRAWFAQPDAGTWERFPSSHPGRLLKLDLAAAGISYVVDNKFFDMHSLRHYYVTQVVNQPGISPRTLLALTRHSSTDLALKTYGKVKAVDLHGAAAQIPQPRPTPEPSAKPNPSPEPPATSA